MRLKFVIKTASFSLFFLLCSPNGIFAGGYAIPHQTARAVALSNAITAGVNDPSAVYYNPAALTEIEGNQILGGLNYINVISSVKNSGLKSRNRRDDNFLPTLFANYHIPETDLTLGFGSYTPFGLATSYDKDAITRFASIRTELKPFYLNWAAAWRATDLISIGAGASFVRGSATLTRAIFLDANKIGIPDGRARLTGTDQAFAFNLGLLLKPLDKLKLGLAFRSRTYLEFDGATVKFSDFDGTPTQTKVVRGGSIVLPAVVSAGLNWKITPSWSLEFVYDWTKWDDLESFKTTFETPLPALGGAVPISGLFIRDDWKNTSTLRLGSLLHLNESWDLMAGIAVDETPIPSKTLNPIIPGADILTLNAGASYTWRKLQLSVGYMAVFYKTRRVQNDVLEASAPPPLTPPFTPGRDKYETFNNFLSFNLRYRFYTENHDYRVPPEKPAPRAGFIEEIEPAAKVHRDVPLPSRELFEETTVKGPENLEEGTLAAERVKKSTLEEVANGIKPAEKAVSGVKHPATKEVAQQRGDMWTVQVSAFSNETNAHNLVSKLKAKGYDAYVILTSIKGLSWYRVRVGHLGTRAEAKELREALMKKEIYTKAFLTDG